MGGRFAMAALLVLTLVAAACGGDDDPGDAASRTTTTSGAPTTTIEVPSDPTSTTTISDATTSSFPGSTTPSSAPPPPSSTEVALLTDVRVAPEGTGDRLVFEFRDGHLPGYDIEYVEPPIRDSASGEPIAVDGDAHLRVRLEPASGVDTRSGSYEPVYTGPSRVAGDGTNVVVEVVRTGDFEANLEWVVGLRRQVAYRVDVVPNPPLVVIQLAG